MSIFVGNLPFRAEQEDVIELFSPFGEVTNCSLPLERWKTFHKYFEEDIYEKLLPSSVVESRLSAGGTGFERVQEQLILWREKLFK